MTRERAERLAMQWSVGGVCSLRDGEATEYHQMFYEMLRAQQEAEKSEPHTNADRIRAMSDEELCKLLMVIPEVPCEQMGYPEECDHKCEACITSWLKRPVGEVWSC